MGKWCIKFWEPSKTYQIFHISRRIIQLNRVPSKYFSLPLNQSITNFARVIFVWFSHSHPVVNHGFDQTDFPRMARCQQCVLCMLHFPFPISSLHLHNALLFRFPPGRMADSATGWLVDWLTGWPARGRATCHCHGMVMGRVRGRESEWVWYG